MLHTFQNPDLLTCALTHRSSLPEVGADPTKANERLELLGDAVLDLIVVEGLWRRYPKLQEGDLSKLKSMLVSGTALHHVAESLHLGRHIVMSESEERNGGRRRGSILEDTLEATIAALYLDGGMGTAKRFVEKYILSRAAALTASKIDINYKSQLLEFAQSRGFSSPHYQTIVERGPDHHKEFEVEVMVGGRVVGKGAGGSKKSAQQSAAKDALSRIEDTFPTSIEPFEPLEADHIQQA